MRRSAQDDGFLGGWKYNWLDMQKTRKAQKVTGSQDDGFAGVLTENIPIGLTLMGRQC
jgi:hypothetical protein